MEDVYVTYLESNVPTLQYICKQLETRKVRATEAQVQHAIQNSAITCKDSDGNYTGSKRMLFTPFNGKSDLDVIRDNIKKAEISLPLPPSLPPSLPPTINKDHS